MELTDGGQTAATTTSSSPLFVGLDDLNLPGRFPDPWRHNADAFPQIRLPSPFPISALSPISPHFLRAVEGGLGSHAAEEQQLAAASSRVSSVL